MKFLREKAPEKRLGYIYVKDAVEFLNLKTFAVQLGTDKLVAFVPIARSKPGERSIGAGGETQDIFTTGTAPTGSAIFVVSAAINGDDFTLRNFSFHFERIVCAPPIPKISNFNEFRAAMILCKQANICMGVKNIHLKSPVSRMGGNGAGKFNLSSPSCSIAAYPHRGSFCTHCKALRGKGSTTVQLNTPLPQMDVLSEMLDDSLRYEIALTFYLLKTSLFHSFSYIRCNSSPDKKDNPPLLKSEYLITFLQCT